MKKVVCKYSPAVHAALKSGVWHPKTRRHFEACRDCQQEAQVRASLGELAVAIQNEEPPVTSQLLWIKARLAERQLAQKKALRPVFYIQTAIQLIIGIGFFILLAMNGKSVAGRLQNLPAGLFDWPSNTLNSGTTLTFDIFSIALSVSIGLLIIFALHARAR